MHLIVSLQLAAAAVAPTMPLVPAFKDELIRIEHESSWYNERDTLVIQSAGPSNPNENKLIIATQVVGLPELRKTTTASKCPDAFVALRSNWPKTYDEIDKKRTIPVVTFDGGSYSVYSQTGYGAVAASKRLLGGASSQVGRWADTVFQAARACLQ